MKSSPVPLVAPFNSMCSISSAFILVPFFSLYFLAIASFCSLAILSSAPLPLNGTRSPQVFFPCSSSPSISRVSSESFNLNLVLLPVPPERSTSKAPLFVLVFLIDFLNPAIGIATFKASSIFISASSPSFIASMIFPELARNCGAINPTPATLTTLLNLGLEVKDSKLIPLTLSPNAVEAFLKFMDVNGILLLACVTKVFILAVCSAVKAGFPAIPASLDILFRSSSSSATFVNKDSLPLPFDSTLALLAASAKTSASLVTFSPFVKALNPPKPSVDNPTIPKFIACSFQFSTLPSSA